jgi:hypothetical protein
MNDLRNRALEVTATRDGRSAGARDRQVITPAGVSDSAGSADER